ncbi:MAG: DUF1540 domain-containing protein [Defluviitaleaceae bacterium]|nr:DUF1540 domain-containing protein [Defluviitaleaceae bacterium]
MINCSVKNCRFNDKSQHCTLEDIKVGCSTTTPHQCCDTECDSFSDSD